MEIPNCFICEGQSTLDEKAVKINCKCCNISITANNTSQLIAIWSGEIFQLEDSTQVSELREKLMLIRSELSGMVKQNDRLQKQLNSLK